MSGNQIGGLGFVVVMLFGKIIHDWTAQTPGTEPTEDGVMAI